jgi:hypothetical protein
VPSIRKRDAGWDILTSEVIVGNIPWAEFSQWGPGSALTESPVSQSCFGPAHVNKAAERTIPYHSGIATTTQ